MSLENFISQIFWLPEIQFPKPLLLCYFRSVHLSHNMSYFTFESIGVPARLNCSCCGSGMDRHRRKPYTGICGHTVCEQCYIANYIGRDGTVPPSPGEFYRCCAPFCDERGFKVGHAVSSSIMGALSLLEQLKWEVNKHLIKIHERYNASDIMALQNELQSTKKELSAKQTELFCAEQENNLLEGDFMRVTKELDETKTKMSMELEEAKKQLADALIGKNVDRMELADALIGKAKDSTQAKMLVNALMGKDRTNKMSLDLEETKKQLADAVIGKEIAEDTLEGVKEYIKGVRKRLDGSPLGPTPEDSPLSTLSQEIEELEAKLHMNKKRDSDSIGTAALMAKNEQNKKARKVSLNGQAMTKRESPKCNSDVPEFPYTADDSIEYTCKSVQSTQENEF